MKPMILLAHITLDGLFGWSLLNFHPNRRTFAEGLLMAVLLGMYLETITAAILMFAGASLTAATIATGLMMITMAAAMFHRNIRHFPRLSIDRLKWYECLALAAIAEKI